MYLLDGHTEEISLEQLPSLAHGQDLVLHTLSIEDVADAAGLQDQVQGALLVMVLKLEGQGPMPHSAIII